MQTQSSETMTEETCPVCSNQRPIYEIRSGASVSDNLQKQIKHDHPDWNESMDVCEHCVRDAKANFAIEILQAEHGELTDLEREVIDSFREGEIMPQNTNDAEMKERTQGEIYADRVTDLIGSWKFVSVILVFLVVWTAYCAVTGIMVNNTVLMLGGISATLGSLAAIQGPIILMSQRRSAKRDRIRAENDFRVNLKAELEIHALNHKLDHIINLQLDNIRRIEELEDETTQTRDD